MGWTPWDRVLVYATGGLIYGHTSVSENLTFTGIAYVASNDSTRSGWTVGGGLEYAFGSNATVRIEGLYYDMGDETISANPLGFYTRSSTFNFKGGIVRAALNYKFAP